MSIESELTALAANKAAIKAAIVAKSPATAPTDALTQWPTSIASIPSGGSDGPKPWVGSGTHCWVHYDSNSSSHGCTLRFAYKGNVVLNWGDDSPTISLSSSTTTTTTQTHTYADGDYRIDISGDPIIMGTYDAQTQTVGYSPAVGFFSDGHGFISVLNNRFPNYRDALVQFETDAKYIVGRNNSNDPAIAATRNLRWIKLTECEILGNGGIISPIGMESLDAPKLKYLYSGFVAQPVSLRAINTPALISYAEPSGSSVPSSFLSGAPSLRSFTIQAGVSALPASCMANALSLEKITFETPRTAQSLDIGSAFAQSTYSLQEVIFPEGITTMVGDVLRDSGVKYIDLPSTLQSIQSGNAFLNTYNLETLICRATTPPTLAGTNIFNAHTSNAKYYIPYGTTAAYTSANNWSRFASLFVELNPDGTIPTT